MPEAAPSPQRELALLKLIHVLVGKQSQFVSATHSPIVLAYPEARIYSLSENGLASLSYEKMERYRVTRDFLDHRERCLRHLLKA